MIKALTSIGCALAVLAACAEMDWTKAGADKAAVTRDLDECRGRALRGVQPPAASVTHDPQAVDRGGSPSGSRPATGANERFIAEHEAVRQCMVARGYKLAPPQ